MIELFWIIPAILVTLVVILVWQQIEMWRRW